MAEAGPVCDRRAEARDQLLARRPGTNVVAQDEAVFGSDVDLVVITTAPDTHAALTRLVLEAGKNVLVEKPFAPEPRDGIELAELAASKRLLLAAAPFVQLSPMFAMLWGWQREGLVGDVHSARAMYGNPGSGWAAWYHRSGVGPLGDLAIYNLKSLTGLLGPVEAVISVRMRSGFERRILDGAQPDPDVVHMLLTHAGGAVSSVMASHAVWAYRRPAIELYGTRGTVNLLGDDWDPTGAEVYLEEWGHWREYPSPDGTWNWTDGLRSAVDALASGSWGAFDVRHDIHVLEVLAACRRSAGDGGARVSVPNGFEGIDLPVRSDVAAHVHDHTRPPGEQ